MPWWATTYLLLFAALCCAGIYHDVSQSEPLWYTFADACSALCSVTAIWAYWHPPIAAALGALLFATTLYAVVWDCFSMEHDLRGELPRSGTVFEGEPDDRIAQHDCGFFVHTAGVLFRFHRGI